MANQLMSTTLSEELQHLMLGYGFNFYRIENQLRADDLLIRQRAGASLGRAAARLDQLAQEFQRTCMPAPSREHPTPPAESMERLNALRRLRQRVMDQNALLQGMSAPAQDKIWRRLRDEQALLEALLQADIALVKLAVKLATQVDMLSAEGWKLSNAATPLGTTSFHWEQALRSRQELLQI
jgi:hypothetical protein